MSSMNRRTFLRRSAMASTAALIPFGLIGCESGISSNEVANVIGGRKLQLDVTISGQTVTREQVLQWEARRIQVVANRMSSNLLAAYLGDLTSITVRPDMDISNIDAEREALADAKMKAGPAAMKQLVANDVMLTTPLSELAATGSFGQWVVSEIDIISDRGTADGFADWFYKKGVTEDDLRAMLVACPDHYFLHGTKPSSQEVIETVGGAVEASHFTINYDNSASLPIVNDPAFPIRFNGAAKNENGTVIGGTNHRMRNLAQGFQLHAAIFFPLTLQPAVVSEHRWHLACEFSNWITAYIKETNS